MDSYYYGKLVVAPLNIVLYNVFTSHGPDLYGELKITRQGGSWRFACCCPATRSRQVWIAQPGFVGRKQQQGRSSSSLPHDVCLELGIRCHCRVPPRSELSCFCLLSSSVNRREMSQRHHRELLVANVSGCYTSAVGPSDTCVCRL